VRYGGRWTNIDGGGIENQNENGSVNKAQAEEPCWWNIFRYSEKSHTATHSLPVATHYCM
jgi:hypothetical protein